MKLVELIVVIVAVLIPQFVLAAEVDGDEFAKATSGIILAGVIVGAYKVWKGQTDVKQRIEKLEDNDGRHPAGD
jgi:L-lactate permease